MSKIPMWARKPNHKKKVIATNRGWEVESTEEVLKCVRNLADKLAELAGDVDLSKIVSNEQTDEPILTYTDPDKVEPESLEVDTKEPEVIKPPRKKRGPNKTYKKTIKD
jgi:hypothetical protein